MIASFGKNEHDQWTSDRFWADHNYGVAYDDGNGGQVDGTDYAYLSPFKHKLCLIVPFRDRMEEVFKFVPHISKFLTKKHISHSTFVVNQADGLRFNRASLINVGFLHMMSARGDPDCDYVGLHDVDLLPLNQDLSYEFPLKGPLHVAAPGLHPKYNYATFVGAILLMTVTDFELIKGMSNKYWGWGWEDDELYHRLVDAGLKVQGGNSIGLSLSPKRWPKYAPKVDRIKSVYQRQVPLQGHGAPKYGPK